MDEDKVKTIYPRTIDEAVRLLQGLVPEEEQARIAYMGEDELPTLDFGLGQWVRNTFGLWNANQALLTDTGEHHPDDASREIIRVFWLRLRDELPKVH